VPATQKLCARLSLKPADFGVIELNEAFAAQGLAVLRGSGIADDAEYVNPNGGAIALAIRWACRVRALPVLLRWSCTSAAARLALATMCIGVGQGIACALERV
jgi:acetyl-CoA acyltransferase